MMCWPPFDRSLIKIAGAHQIAAGQPLNERLGQRSAFPDFL
jgi:hypothetical protein